MCMYQEDVIYGQVLGAGLVADIAAPDSTGPLPIILSVHGGRWIRGDRRDTTTIDVKQWATFGFFAMSIDYRLVTCSPAPACYQDLLCAVRWVHAHRDRYDLDLNRFYLMGMSAGGHMVSLAATLGTGRFARSGGWEDQPHSFTAALSVSGAYDLRRLAWGSGWLPPGEPWDVARTYGSPLEHVSATTRPILMLHSDDDTSIPIQQAVQMAQALKQTGAKHSFVRYADRGHMPINAEVIAQCRGFIADLK